MLGATLTQALTSALLFAVIGGSALAFGFSLALDARKRRRL